MPTTVERYVAAVLQGTSYEEYRAAPSMAPFLQFVDPKDQELFAWVDKYVLAHKQLPSIPLTEEQLGVSLPKPDGAAAYWADRLERQHIRRALAVMAQGVGENLSKGEEEDLLAKARESIRQIDLSRTSMRMLDFRQGMAAMDKQWAEAGAGLTLGWPTLDGMMGGARAGDLISMVARPKLGKSYLLLYSALHVWRTARLPVLFLSMEMVPELIVERLAALATSTPATYLKTNQWPSFSKGVFGGKQSDNKTKKIFRDKMGLIEKDDVPLWIADGNLAATVDDLEALVDKLGPCIVYADGAYLIQDPERDPYRRVGVVCNKLKQRVATARRIPVFASWQFSREATKLKEGDTPGIEHVAHSDVIGMTSSVVMGMFEHETVETKLRRLVSILAGRSGETGSFQTHWDFDRMNLAEIAPSEDEAPLVMA